MKFCILATLTILIAAVGEYAIAQPKPSTAQDELLPTFGFPSVAVVKLDEEDVLRILVPSATVPHPNSIPISVEETYVVEENGVGVNKIRTVERRSEYLPDTFRMVRTQLRRDKIRLRDQAGNILDVEKISKAVKKPTYVILVQGGSIDSSRQSYFREGVMVIGPEDLDPNCWYGPEVVGLAPKWTRTEPLPKPAVAKLVNKATNLEITYVKMGVRQEERFRTVTDASGKNQTVSYTVSVSETVAELLPVEDCVFSNASGKSQTKDFVVGQLAQPTRVLWDSTITQYLGSVLKTDIILINRK
jgi:hypothetical protein